MYVYSSHPTAEEAYEVAHKLRSEGRRVAMCSVHTALFPVTTANPYIVIEEVATNQSDRGG